MSFVFKYNLEDWLKENFLGLFDTYKRYIVHKRLI